MFFMLVLGVVFAGLAIFSSATLGLLARESSSVSRDILLQAGLGLGLGFISLLAARAVSLARIKRLAPYIYVATILFTALVFVPGIGFHSGGATRWIDLGFTTVQPSEFLKIGFRARSCVVARAARRANSRMRRKGYFLSSFCSLCQALSCSRNRIPRRRFSFSRREQ